MKYFILKYRRPVVVILHLLLVVVSNYLAFLLRFDGTVPSHHVGPLLNALPLLLAVRGVSFWFFRLYQGLWRYVSLWDLNNIILSVVASSIAFGLVVRGPIEPRAFAPYPRSVILIDSILLICLLGGVRLLRRMNREFERLQHEKRVLIYGAGDAGEMIVRDIKNNSFYNWDPIGFVDDDPVKVGRTIHGVKVLGTGENLPAVLVEQQPQEVLVAIARAEPAVLRRIVRSLERFKVPIKTLPNLRDVLDGKVTIKEIRNLSLEDLMPRKPVDLDAAPVHRLINGRRVLITGAGGSIGSELSRQVLSFGPSKAMLLDRYENGLFRLYHELDRLYPGADYDALVCDVADAMRVDRLFSQSTPEVVFHAAAHKHVPLMERNAAEAVKNNVRATRILTEAAARHGVADFVLISTDKAVNPSSVMGATKRVSEQIVLALDRQSGTRFVAVRFGNVLGSNGSVGEIFAAQIERGGPVTVTHPAVRRYFMLIPEAVQLVLHAAAMRDRGTIYVLDMGDQIRIQDLARNMIRLSGLVPDEDIAIQYCGLRPGEKLDEEMVEAGEPLQASDVRSVFRVRPEPPAWEELKAKVARLERAGDESSEGDVIALLTEIVPSFRTGADPSRRAAVQAAIQVS